MRPFVFVSFLVALSVSLLAACASPSSDAETAPQDNDSGVSLGDGGFVDATVPDGEKPMVDGGFVSPDGSVVRADRFATTVVSFTPGPCAGFGIPGMPKVIQGPPVGAGDTLGGTDVVSLGEKGEIVVAFGENAIVDAPGPDFIVFENPFFAAGDPKKPNAELAEVSVSDDGSTWKAFPCALASAPPYGTCAGWRPVYSAPGNGISPFDPGSAGGDAFDLADVGLASARFVRIRDMGSTACDAQTKPTNTGFDLDAVAILHAKSP